MPFIDGIILFLSVSLPGFSFDSGRAPVMYLHPFAGKRETWLRISKLMGVKKLFRERGYVANFSVATVEWSWHLKWQAWMLMNTASSCLKEMDIVLCRFVWRKWINSSLTHVFSARMLCTVWRASTRSFSLSSQFHSCAIICRLYILDVTGWCWCVLLTTRWLAIILYLEQVDQSLHLVTICPMLLLMSFHVFCCYWSPNTFSFCLGWPASLVMPGCKLTHFFYVLALCVSVFTLAFKWYC